MNMPVLFQSIDENNRISSKWIARESGKFHHHVIRDIETLINSAKSQYPKLDSSERTEVFDYERRLLKNGQTKEILINLTLAVVVLSRYKGPKAEGCFRLVVAAVDYFLHRAPYAEKRLKELEEELEKERLSRKRKHLTESKEPSKVLVRVLINEVLPGFQPYFIDRFVSPEMAKDMRQEYETAKLAHLRRTEAGVSKKRKTQEDFVLGVLT